MGGNAWGLDKGPKAHPTVFILDLGGKCGLPKPAPMPAWLQRPHSSPSQLMAGTWRRGLVLNNSRIHAKEGGESARWKH